ncbi:MAG TPA: hypothetical protein VMW76_09140 [Bacteroidales bacterium]|nr:hypothetical protein [Bacteroidales bacterium]
MKHLPMLLLGLILLMPGDAFSQVYENPIFQHLEYMRRERLLNDYNELLYENIEGTPFFTEEFIKGIVYMKSGESYTGEFRYDIYADQIQFIGGEKIYCIAFPEKLSYVLIGDMSIKYVGYEQNGVPAHGYFITLEDGYYSLYLKKGKVLNDPVGLKPYQSAKPAKFVDKIDIYYIKIGENPALRVKGMRNLLKLLPGEKDNIRDYIDSEGIKPGNRFDLVKLVLYLNKSD